MKKTVLFMTLCIGIFSMTFSMKDESHTHNDNSIDALIERYDPCTVTLNHACKNLFGCIQSTIKQIELLHRAFNADEVKIKQD